MSKQSRNFTTFTHECDCPDAEKIDILAMNELYQLSEDINNNAYGLLPFLA